MHEHAVLVCQLSSRHLLSTQNAELEVLNEPTDDIYSYNIQDLKTKLYCDAFWPHCYAVMLPSAVDLSRLHLLQHFDSLTENKSITFVQLETVSSYVAQT